MICKCMLHYQVLTSGYWSRGLKDSCEEETSSEDSQDNDEEITRRRKPNKKGMQEKSLKEQHIRIPMVYFLQDKP
jgi:hypothetical protein